MFVLVLEFDQTLQLVRRRTKDSNHKYWKRDTVKKCIKKKSLQTGENSITFFFSLNYSVFLRSFSFLPSFLTPQGKEMTCFKEVLVFSFRELVFKTMLCSAIIKNRRGDDKFFFI